MTFFFFVLGLEARREFDLGDFRERRRFVLPMLASIGGMGAAVAIYLAFNLGSSSAQGWGIAMSTDTAFALGLLALVGRRAPDRLRAFMLTVVIVDDLLALVVIAIVYSESIEVMPLIWAAGLFAVVLVLRLRAGAAARCTSCSASRSGSRCSSRASSRVVVGLAIGLLVWATPAARSDLEPRRRALPRVPRAAHAGAPALGAREHQDRDLAERAAPELIYHPWTSYVIVPLFALANAGIAIDGDFLERAAGSPITLGVLVGYVAGKPLGDRRHGRCSSPGCRAGGCGRRSAGRAVAGAGASAGVGFTVSLLVATLAFDGAHLEEAKVGILAAAVGAAAAHLAGVPRHRHCCRCSAGSRPCSAAPSRSSISISESTPSRDHIRGPLDAPVTVVEYGDFECPYCGRAEPAVRELLRDFADVRYVWRHLPLTDVHPHAAARRRGLRGRRRSGRVLADARPAARAPGCAADRRSDVVRRAARARRRALHRGPAKATSARSGSPRTWRART